MLKIFKAYKIKIRFSLRTIGSDHLIVAPSQDMVDLSTVYTLNRSAAWLWEQLKGKEFTIDTIGLSRFSLVHGPDAGADDLGHIPSFCIFKIVFPQDA